MRPLLNRKPSYSLSIRSISLLLVLSFAFTDAARAFPAGTPSKSPAQNPALLHISPEFGSVRDIHKGTRPKLIVHFEDAHANLSAQTNLARILEDLVEKNQLKNIFVEGGTGSQSLSRWRGLAPRAVRERVAKKYLLKGELNGDEYLSLVSDRDIDLWGVEDERLYRESLEKYADLAGEREETLESVGRVRARTRSLERRWFPDEAVQFSEFLEKFEGNEIDFTEYQAKISGLASRHRIRFSVYPNLASLARLKALEETIDFAAANREQLDLVTRIAESDSGDPSLWGPESLRAADKIKWKQEACVERYDELLAEAARQNLEPRRYENLVRYVDYLKQFARVDFRELADEMNQIEENLYRKMLPDPEVFYLHEITSYLDILENLFSLRISRDGFDAYLRQSRDLRFELIVILSFLNRKLYDFGRTEDILAYDPVLEDRRAQAEAFYRLTEARDRAFVDKTLRRMDREKISTAALITGGFHTENLKSLFNEKGVSYVVVTPKITNETNQTRYEKILLSQLDPAGHSRPARESEGVSGTRADEIRFTIQRPNSPLPAILNELGATDRSSGARLAAHIMSDDPWGMPGVLWRRVNEFNEENNERMNYLIHSQFQISRDEFDKLLEAEETKQFFKKPREKEYLEFLKTQPFFDMTDKELVFELVYRHWFSLLLDETQDVLKAYYKQDGPRYKDKEYAAAEFQRLHDGPFPVLIQLTGVHHDRKFSDKHELNYNQIWWLLKSRVMIIRGTFEDVNRALRGEVPPAPGSAPKSPGTGDAPSEGARLSQDVVLQGISSHLNRVVEGEIIHWSPRGQNGDIDYSIVEPEDTVQFIARKVDNEITAFETVWDTVERHAGISNSRSMEKYLDEIGTATKDIILREKIHAEHALERAIGLVEGRHRDEISPDLYLSLPGAVNAAHGAVQILKSRDNLMYLSHKNGLTPEEEKRIKRRLIELERENFLVSFYEVLLRHPFGFHTDNEHVQERERDTLSAKRQMSQEYLPSVLGEINKGNTAKKAIQEILPDLDRKLDKLDQAYLASPSEMMGRIILEARSIKGYFYSALAAMKTYRLIYEQSDLPEETAEKIKRETQKHEHILEETKNRAALNEKILKRFDRFVRSKVKIGRSVEYATALFAADYDTRFERWRKKNAGRQKEIEQAIAQADEVLRFIMRYYDIARYGLSHQTTDRKFVVLAESITDETDYNDILGDARGHGTVVAIAAPKSQIEEGRYPHWFILAGKAGIIPVMNIAFTPESMAGGRIRGLSDIPTGMAAVVDGENGRILLNPSNELREVWLDEGAGQRLLEKFVSTRASEPARLNGREYEIWIDESYLPHFEAKETGPSLASLSGSTGVGLLRLEELILEEDRAGISLDEERLSLSFSDILSQDYFKNGRPLTVRLFDFQEDKGLTLLRILRGAGLTKEEGHRLLESHSNVRFYLDTRPEYADFREYGKMQLRALLRAYLENAPKHNLRLLFSNVQTLPEIDAIEVLIEEARDEVLRSVPEEKRAAASSFMDTIPVGYMFEDVRAVKNRHDLLKRIRQIRAKKDSAGFVAVGTSDLQKSILAEEHENDFTKLHPRLIREIAKAAQAAAEADLPITVDGEWANSPLLMYALIGLDAFYGLRTIWVPQTDQAPMHRELIRRLRLEDLNARLDGSPEDFKDMLARIVNGGQMPDVETFHKTAEKIEKTVKRRLLQSPEYKKYVQEASNEGARLAQSSEIRMDGRHEELQGIVRLLNETYRTREAPQTYFKEIILLSEGIHPDLWGGLNIILTVLSQPMPVTQDQKVSSRFEERLQTRLNAALKNVNALLSAQGFKIDMDLEETEPFTVLDVEPTGARLSERPYDDDEHVWHAHPRLARKSALDPAAEDAAYLKLTAVKAFRERFLLETPMFYLTQADPQFSVLYGEALLEYVEEAEPPYDYESYLQFLRTRYPDLMEKREAYAKIETQFSADSRYHYLERLNGNLTYEIEFALARYVERSLTERTFNGFLAYLDGFNNERRLDAMYRQVWTAMKAALALPAGELVSRYRIGRTDDLKSENREYFLKEEEETDYQARRGRPVLVSADPVRLESSGFDEGTDLEQVWRSDRYENNPVHTSLYAMIALYLDEKIGMRTPYRREGLKGSALKELIEHREDFFGLKDLIEKSVGENGKPSLVSLLKEIAGTAAPSSGARLAQTGPETFYPVDAAGIEIRIPGVQRALRVEKMETGKLILTLDPDENKPGDTAVMEVLSLMNVSASVGRAPSDLEIPGFKGRFRVAFRVRNGLDGVFLRDLEDLPAVPEVRPLSDPSGARLSESFDEAEARREARAVVEGTRPFMRNIEEVLSQLEAGPLDNEDSSALDRLQEISGGMLKWIRGRLVGPSVSETVIRKTLTLGYPSEYDLANALSVYSSFVDLARHKRELTDSYLELFHKTQEKIRRILDLLSEYADTGQDLRPIKKSGHLYLELDPAKRSADGARLAAHIVLPEEKGNFTPVGLPVVIVAEDDLMLQGMYRMVLPLYFGAEKYQFVFVTSLEAARRALDIVQTEDLRTFVISDNSYPEMDDSLMTIYAGVELTQIAKKRGIGIVIVSGEDVVFKPGEARPDLVLTKPLDLQTVRTKLKTLVEEKLSGARLSSNRKSKKEFNVVQYFIDYRKEVHDILENPFLPEISVTSDLRFEADRLRQKGLSEKQIETVLKELSSVLHEMLQKSDKVRQSQSDPDIYYVLSTGQPHGSRLAAARNPDSLAALQAVHYTLAPRLPSGDYYYLLSGSPADERDLPLRLAHFRFGKTLEGIRTLARTVLVEDRGDLVSTGEVSWLWDNVVSKGRLLEIAQRQESFRKNLQPVLPLPRFGQFAVETRPADLGAFVKTMMTSAPDLGQIAPVRYLANQSLQNQFAEGLRTRLGSLAGSRTGVFAVDASILFDADGRLTVPDFSQAAQVLNHALEMYDIKGNVALAVYGSGQAPAARKRIETALKSLSVVAPRIRFLYADARPEDVKSNGLTDTVRKSVESRLAELGLVMDASSLAVAYSAPNRSRLGVRPGVRYVEVESADRAKAYTSAMFVVLALSVGDDFETGKLPAELRKFLQTIELDLDGKKIVIYLLKPMPIVNAAVRLIQTARQATAVSA